MSILVLGDINSEKSLISLAWQT